MVAPFNFSSKNYIDIRVLFVSKIGGFRDAMKDYRVLWVNHAMCTWGAVCRILSDIKV